MWWLTYILNILYFDCLENEDQRRKIYEPSPGVFFTTVPPGNIPERGMVKTREWLCGGVKWSSGEIVQIHFLELHDKLSILSEGKVNVKEYYT